MAYQPAQVGRPYHHRKHNYGQHKHDDHNPIRSRFGAPMENESAQGRGSDHKDAGRPYAHYRCAPTFDKLIAWLRSKGVTGEKPLHTLRKEFGSLIAQKFGIFAAQQMLGHSDITTTSQHYIEVKEKPILSLL